MFALTVEEYQTKGGSKGIPGKGYDVALVELAFEGQPIEQGTRITGWGPDKAHKIANALVELGGEAAEPLARRIRAGADKCVLLQAEKNATKRQMTAKTLETL